MTAPAAPALAATTVHLARIQLSARSREVYEDLRDATRLHHRVQSLFPDALGITPRAATNTLFRLERERSGATLLVQSTLPINGNALPNGYAAAVEHRELTPLLHWVTDGRLVRYRIDANPTKSVKTPGSRERGRRTPLVGEEAITWWDRKARAAGLECAVIVDIRQPDLVGDRGEDAKGKKNRPVRLRAIRFEGVATVHDSDAVRTAITTGIGQGRAYGLGLLSIAPHRP